MKTAVLVLFTFFGVLVAQDCVADWGKCGGQGYSGPTTCCNSRYFCNYTDDYYSECVPMPLIPFPPAPPSAYCGPQGMTLNYSLLKYPGSVTSAEIAIIWASATNGLTQGATPGGNVSCIAAVSIAIGECGHPTQSDWLSVNDPVCSFDASGAGGIWQVTSQDSDDVTLAGCSNGEDPCCNARLAYAHAYNQGGAAVVPADYCSQQQDCTQIYSDPGGKTGAPWNDPTVDQTKPNAKIPFCNYTCNPWYSNCGKSLAYISIDQEPCYWGPFSVAAGGVGKEFFPGFYGWGGFLQHYLDSKAGMCDPSPQAVTKCDPNSSTMAKYPSYVQLGVQACPY